MRKSTWIRSSCLAGQGGAETDDFSVWWVAVGAQRREQIGRYVSSGAAFQRGKSTTGRFRSLRQHEPSLGLTLAAILFISSSPSRSNIATALVSLRPPPAWHRLTESARTVWHYHAIHFTRAYNSMEVRFLDGDEFPSRPLLQEIPTLIRRAEVLRSRDALKLRKIIGKLRVLISGEPHFQCKINGYDVLYFSRHVVEVLWASVCAQIMIYRRVFAGRQVGGLVIDAEADPSLKLPRDILNWAKNEASYEKGVCEGDGRLPEGFRWPVSECAPGSPEEFAARVVPFALQFYLFHELAHSFLRERRLRPTIREERACDAMASRWIMAYPCHDATEAKNLKLGVTTAAIYVAVRGIDSGNVDGIEHPLCYDRLVDILEDCFGSRDDEVWGLTTAILAVHATNCGIDLHERTFDEFHPAVIAFRDAVHEEFRGPMTPRHWPRELGRILKRRWRDLQLWWRE